MDVEVSFAFDASDFAGRTITVFERLYQQDEKISDHADLKNEKQQIAFPEHKLETTATDQDTGGHEAEAKEQTTIVDAVSYSGLIVGQEYTLKGILMLKDTGKPLEVHGQQITAEKSFKPEGPEGTVELEFTFDSSALEGSEVVVFEHLYVQGTEVAAHTDIKDKGQTVKFQGENPAAVKTGDGPGTGYLILGAAMLISSAAFIAAVLRRRKKRSGYRFIRGSVI